MLILLVLSFDLSGLGVITFVLLILIGSCFYYNTAGLSIGLG